MEEKRRDEIEIDWGELGGALLSKSLLILIITALCAVAAFFGTKWLISPKYTSTSSVYIMNRQNESQISASDLSSADMLTKDCQKLALSRNVLDEVSERLGLGLDYGQMKEKIAVSIQNDTRVLTFSATDEDPGRAKEMADTISEITRGKIKEIMGVEEVNIIDEGDYPLTPSSPNWMMNTALAAALGLFASTAAVALLFIADDTIKTSDDISDYLGATTIGVIPNVGDEKEKRARTEKRAKRR
ncbi:MAG TPA: hypothetical protein IAB48_06910 [Candidatus Fimimorpha excrementavium]|nr:hypothetical protein [Candidatus Fimimorpha excrementavium]